MTDWVQELEQLAKLKEDGIIDEHEFMSAKQAVLEKKDNPQTIGDTASQETGFARSEQPGKGFAITALVLGILSLGFLPVLFGPLGVLFGSLSWKKGNSFGMISTLVAISCSYLGMVIGALVWSVV